MLKVPTMRVSTDKEEAVMLHSASQPTRLVDVKNNDNSETLLSRPMKIEIRDLEFYYGDYKALHNINLSIPEKQVVAFIGPSGCGKSTLLRTFNRIYELYPKQRTRGEVLLDSENVLDQRYDLNRLRARVGMVFQKPTPFPMSIFENVAFGVRLYERLSRRQMEERVE